ncbi:cytochrome b5, seed isoform-like [Primulina tabacum]|uniref:cytochrome b5, seed isoform-like n=1 Tax=Primulina tabacum TaxID=48773 RepID=UPI003F5A3582
MAAKPFTFSEVSEHNTNKDCWLIINGKVYDVTKFLEDHSGGDEVLLSSPRFQGCRSQQNTAEAMLPEFYVGDVNLSTIPNKINYSPPKQPHYNQDKTPQFIVKLLQFLVPFPILELAFG